MNDVFNRLYRTKLILSCVLLTTSGIILLVVARQIGDDPGWVNWLPLGELGGILVGAGVLGVLLDAYLAREQGEIDELRLRRILSEHAPEMRDAVLAGFAAGTDDLKRVATPELLDNLITNGLSLRLGNHQFASEIYTDIRDQAITAAERWHDATLSVELRPLPAGRGVPKRDTRSRSAPRYYSVTVRWEYTTIPGHAQRRFVCLSDRDEYAELSLQRGSTSAWFIPSSMGMDAAAPETFVLERFTVDGHDRPIRRTARKNAQTYTVTLDQAHLAAGEPVTIAYSYRAVMATTGNHLFFDIEQPTEDLRVDFDYTGTGIDRVSVLDLIPTVRPSRIETPIAGSHVETIRVHIDGWTFPRSGVAFVWTPLGDRQSSSER